VLIEIGAWIITSLGFALALFIALAILEMKAGFRQDQPRNDKGRWSGGGGSIIVTQKDSTGDPRIDAKTDQILDVLKEVIESSDPGQGAL
jgi:hypothetical protein